MDPLNWTAYQALSDLGTLLFYVGVSIKTSQYLSVSKVTGTWGLLHSKPKEYNKFLKLEKQLFLPTDPFDPKMF